MKTYRHLIESLCAAIKEEIIETGSVDDVPPSAQARYDAMLRALGNEAVCEAAFRVHTISFVRLVEYAFRAHRGCPVRLQGLLGEVYTQAVALLVQECRYPVIRPRRKRYADYLLASAIRKPAAPEPEQEEPEDEPEPDHPVYRRPSPLLARSRAVHRIADRYAHYDISYFQGGNHA